MDIKAEKHLGADQDVGVALEMPGGALTASPMISFRRISGTIEGSGMRVSGTQSFSVSGGSDVSNFRGNSPRPGQPVLSL